jgi:Tfp pilus assembly protein PilO
MAAKAIEPAKQGLAPQDTLMVRLRENPKLTARIILGTLLALNLVAAIALLEPFGGSPEGLEASRNRLEGELAQQQVQLASLRALAEKMQASEAEGAEFIEAYFLEQRRASSEILQTLDAIEQRTGIRPRGKTFGIESIEGTSDFVMLTIAANYEGTYADLVEFGSEIDRSERLLILDSLQVAPQQDGDTLQVQAQLYGFVRQNNALPVLEEEVSVPEVARRTDADAAQREMGVQP